MSINHTPEETQIRFIVDYISMLYPVKFNHNE